MRKSHLTKWLFFLAFLLSFQNAKTIQAEQFPLQASYHIDSFWSSGYEVTVTLKNTSTQNTSNWTATFSLPTAQTISSLWNGVFSTSGSLITVKNPTWSGGEVIPAGGSTTFGMVINNPNGSAIGLNNLQAYANAGTTSPTLSAPVLKPISLSSPSSYTVAWNSVPNASSYTLQEDTSANFTNPKTVAQTNTLSKSFTNKPNGTYYYRVQAANASGSSPFSNIQSIAVNVPIFLDPPVLSAISNPSGENSYAIYWTTVQNAQGYILEESTDPSFSIFTAIYNGAQPQFNIFNKALGVYYYRVKAYSGSLNSQPSNVVNTQVTQGSPSSNAFVEGYWESWNTRESVSTIVNMKVDIIDIAFGNFTLIGPHTYKVSGVEASTEAINQLVSLAHQAGKKVKLSIGGATYGLSGQLLTNEDAHGMAQAVAQYVQQFSLDGVDYDIEDYPAPALQIELIKQTRTLLGNSLIVSYTPKAPASTTYPYNQVIVGAHPYLSYLSIMAYDYGPGYTYQQDVAALKDMGVPSNKIVVGLMPGYDDLHVMTSLNDIANAANFIIQNNLGGIMFWDLNRDHENLTGLGVDAATNTAWDIIH